MSEISGVPAFNTLSNGELADLYASGVGAASMLESLANQLAEQASTIRGDVAEIQLEISKRLASGSN